MALAELESQLLSSQEIEHIAAQDWEPEQLEAALHDQRAIVRANAVRIVGWQARDAAPEAQAEALETLRPLGDDSDAEVRRALIAAVADTRHPRALSLIAARLTDVAVQVRSDASERLAGLSPEEIPALFSGLNAAQLAEKNIEALSLVLLEIGPNVLPALQDALTHSENPSVRCLAADALGRFGKLAAASLGSLVNALRDKDGGVRKTVILSLDKIARGREPEIRQSGESSFPIPGFFSEHLSVDDLAEPPMAVSEARLLTAAESDSPFARANAARALAGAPETSREATEQLGILLCDRDDSVREAAMAAITHLGARGMAAAPWLLNCLNGPHRDALGERAADLIEAHFDQVEDSFINYLRSDTTALKDALPPLLDRLGERIIPLLVRGLRHPSVLVRLNSVMLLRMAREFCVDDAFEALKEASLNEPNGDVRLAARATVSMIEEERKPPEAPSYRSPAEQVIDALEDLDGDPDPDVKRTALQIMRQLDHDRPPPPPPEIVGFDEQVLDQAALSPHTDAIEPGYARALLLSPAVVTRVNAARLLGLYEAGEENTDALASALLDTSEQVRRAAMEALRGLGSEALVRGRTELLRALADSDDAVAEGARTAILGLGEEGLALLADSGLITPDAERSVLPLLKAQGEAVIPFLARSLNHSSVSARKLAARALLAQGDAGLKALIGEGGQVQSAHDVVLPLILERKGEGVPALIEALSHEAVRTRELAALALFRLGGKLAAPARDALITAIHSEPRLKEVGMRAVRAIDKALAPPIFLEPTPFPVEKFETEILEEEVLEANISQFNEANLIRALGDGRATVRANACYTLGLMETANPEAVMRLLLALKDSDVDARYAAAHALTQVEGDAGQIVSAIAQAMVKARGAEAEAMLDAIKTFEDRRFEAMLPLLDEDRWPEIFARLHPSLDTEEIETFKQLLTSVAEDDARGSRAQRTAAQTVRRLSVPPPPPVVREPETMPIDGFDAEVLSESVLKSAAKKLDVDQLMRFLQDGRAPVRENATRALGLLGVKRGAKAILHLLVMLRDIETSVRSAAIASLLNLKVKPDQVIPAFIRARHEAPEPLGEQLLEAIESFGDEAIPVLMLRVERRWQHPDRMMYTLVERSPQRFIKPLIEAAGSDREIASRANALDLLKRIGAPAVSAKAAAVAALGEKRGMVRANAIRCLTATQSTLDAPLLERIKEFLETDLRRSVRHAVVDAIDTFDGE